MHTLEKLSSPKVHSRFFACLLGLCCSLLFIFGFAMQAYAVSAKALLEAANAGDSSAANTLGVWYEKGKNGLPVDPQKALFWYRKAAAGGSVLAMHNIGDCYKNRVGVGYDPVQAFFWYKEAAEKGGPIGYEDIGDFFRYIGFSGPNKELALVWYKEAAKQGRKGAQEKLLSLGGKRERPGRANPPCQKILSEESLTGSLWNILDDQMTGEIVVRIAKQGDVIDLVIPATDRDEAVLQRLQGLLQAQVSLDYSLVQTLHPRTAQCVKRSILRPASLKKNAPKPVSAPKPSTPSKPSTPPEDVYVGYEGLLLGASLSGTWVDAKSLQNDARYHEKRLNGGLEGKLYNADGFLSLCTMGALSWDHPEMAEELGPLADFPFFDYHTPDGRKDTAKTLFLASSEPEYDPFPRKVRHENTEASRFIPLVRDFLTDQGLPNAEIRLKDVVAIDLDGDGNEEHIVTAENFFVPEGIPAIAKRGMYSLVLFVSEKDGQTESVPISYYIAPAEFDPSRNTPPLSNYFSLACDVNGDGVLEILISSQYYEGCEYILYSIHNGQLREVLRQGYGV